MASEVIATITDSDTGYRFRITRRDDESTLHVGQCSYVFEAFMPKTGLVSVKIDEKRSITLNTDGSGPLTTEQQKEASDDLLRGYDGEGLGGT